MSIRVLLAEREDGDYDSIFAQLTENLGVNTDVASNLTELFTLLSKFHYDLIIIQVTAPWPRAVEPITVLRGLSAAPILALLKSGNHTDFVRVLEVADDCLQKPYDFDEAVARGAALIKQPIYPDVGRPSSYDYVYLRDLLIMPDFHRVFIEGNEVYLRRKEFDLLLFMARHKDQVLSKDQLYDVIWPNDINVNVNRIVAYHISNLRKKLRQHTKRKYIDTVHGGGYRLLSYERSEPPGTLKPEQEKAAWH